MCPDWLWSWLCRLWIVVTVVTIMAVGALVSTVFHLVARAIALVRGPAPGSRPLAVAGIAGAAVAAAVATPGTPTPASREEQVLRVQAVAEGRSTLAEPSSAARRESAACPVERVYPGSASDREGMRRDCGPSALDVQRAGAPPGIPSASNSGRQGLVDSLAD